MSTAISTEKFKDLLEKTSHWDKDERYMVSHMYIVYIAYIIYLYRYLYLFIEAHLYFY